MHVNPAYRIEPNRRVLTRARGSRSFGSPTFEAGWVAQPAPQDAVVPTGAFKRQDLPEAAEQAHPVNFHFRNTQAQASLCFNTLGSNFPTNGPAV